MGQQSCTNCGKPLYEGDWVSKSGLCKPCAEAKYDERNKPKHLKWIIIIVSAMILTWVAVIVGAFYGQAPNAGDSSKLADGFVFVGEIEKTDNLVFLGLSDDPTLFTDRVKDTICNALFIDKMKEYPSIDVITVIICDQETDEYMLAFSELVKDDIMLDLDEDLAMAAIALAEGDWYANQNQQRRMARKIRPVAAQGAGRRNPQNVRLLHAWACRKSRGAS